MSFRRSLASFYYNQCSKPGGPARARRFPGGHRGQPHRPEALVPSAPPGSCARVDRRMVRRWLRLRRSSRRAGGAPRGGCADRALPRRERPGLFFGIAIGRNGLLPHRLWGALHTRALGYLVVRPPHRCAACADTAPGVGHRARHRQRGLGPRPGSSPTVRRHVRGRVRRVRRGAAAATPAACRSAQILLAPEWVDRSRRSRWLSTSPLR